MHFVDLYEEFLLLPRGISIEDPLRVIRVGAIDISCKRIIKTHAAGVYITRRALKHIAEKPRRFPILLLSNIPYVLKYPDQIRYSKKISGGANRYLFVKKLLNYSRPMSVVVEVSVKRDINTIVTFFPISEKYISNFGLLWKTGAN